ncbi:Uncharacterized protein EJ110_NYTH54554 [Nymphaea thermarum]|nr:Uncharacterized protein EJ110_NYTH54554 [Nymphaea thermarum]
MVEGTKARLVRCPKCENLLVEPADYPVYQCGGCGAKLQSAKRYAASLKQKFKEEENGLAGGEREVVPTELPNSEREGVSTELPNSVDESSPSHASEEAQSLGGEPPKKETVGDVVEVFGEMSEEKERGVIDDEPVPSPEVTVLVAKKENRESQGIVPSNESEVEASMVVGQTDEVLGNGSVVESAEGTTTTSKSGTGDSTDAPVKNSTGSDRSSIMNDGGELDSRQTKGKGLTWGSVDQISVPPDIRRDESDRGLRTRPLLDGCSKYRVYPDEGPSNFHHGGARDYEDGFFGHAVPGANRVEHLEQDRRELLKKLDELREQITRSCDISGLPPNDGIPLNARRTRGFPQQGSYGPVRNLRDHSRHEDLMRRPYYYSRDLEFDSHQQAASHTMMGRQHLGVPAFGHHRHAHDELLNYKDPYGDELIRIPAHQAPRFPHMPMTGRGLMSRDQNSYFTGRYVETDPDSVDSFPICSCSNCYYGQLKVPAQAQSRLLYHQRMPKLVGGPMYYHDDADIQLVEGIHDYIGLDAARPPLSSYQSSRTVRRAAYTDIEQASRRQNRGLPRDRPEVGYTRGCFPIGGGAPFISCCHCLQLLKLPEKFRPQAEGSCKLQCGACSKIILVSFDGKSLNTSVDAGSVHSESREEVFSRIASSTTGQCNFHDRDYSHGQINPSRGAHENRRSAFPSHLSNRNMTENGVLLCHPVDQMEERPNLSEPEKGQSEFSSSSASQDGQGSDNLATSRKLYNQLSFKSGVDSPAASSPPQEDSGHSSYDEMVSNFEGTRSKRSDEQKFYPSQGTSKKKSTRNFKQHSFKEPSVATEIELSMPKDSSLDVSQDPGEGTREESAERSMKGSESFFTNLIKKSFKDFSRVTHSSDSEKTHVSVNGKPIPEKLVRKAEKQAGPIYPGNYWYDPQAGFWGVMGQPCIGIIPPSIEEFDYPVPKDCSGGSTGVLVNGRELHQKDLDLLISRGLPTTRDKSYIIEISGKVFDEATGEELDCLGKLAPT